MKNIGNRIENKYYKEIKNPFDSKENVLNEALPCPFCGNKPDLHAETNLDDNIIQYFELKCDTCELRFGFADGEGLNIKIDDYLTKRKKLNIAKDLVKKWNKRYM